MARTGMEGPRVPRTFVGMTHKGYEAVIGLEVHVQLSTKSKAYAGEGYDYGGAPNTQVSPVSLGGCPERFRAQTGAS